MLIGQTPGTSNPTSLAPNPSRTLGCLRALGKGVAQPQILDGHGSPLTDNFLHYCLTRKIYVAVFSPHSTHTLQPLDVVCFKPLANAYSQKLANFTQRSQGLVPIKKGDFFLLFWDSWCESFTKRTILRSFAATGIWRMDRERVLKRFPPKPPNKPNNKLEPTWRESDRLLPAAVNTSSPELKKISTLLHHLANQNELLTDENEGLREALTTKRSTTRWARCLICSRGRSITVGLSSGPPERWLRLRLMHVIG
jgi:hypothetical protein